MKLSYQRLHPNAIEPQRMSEHASGYDLFACLDQACILAPGQREAIATGIALAIPEGYEAQIRPRSGLALKCGLGVLNSPGTIDADYRGEIKVILVNLGSQDVIIEPGMRIAQMVFHKIEVFNLQECDSLKETLRNAGGFGHTGT
ncbi:MAG: dUTP diphosphatase [Candidatus Cloacimonetes bacterium]|nr:dUTP diphosphatase [Candidatus Cloacimonadota bacterium]MDD2543937.1 dUTP diphosphatase [Candidatus Cloacimonadota bacterium]MDD2683952.1 dUTP diphosphatase [Candidatus Cloacimonadota bacterium]MDD3096925.1 dUTP diphosphatase [Candidatus Cloacimonadota bacterium]MDD3578977.1 dUTP diphosphatase [Candidatus Cloacimonadota bacterium]